ncbi:MAG: M28 family peptidase [Candidatus Hodarchaeota archaeon]
MSSKKVEFFENRYRLIQDTIGTATTTNVGTVGSNAWVDKAIDKGIEILGALNLEMVGYVSKKPNSQKMPSLVSPEWFKKYQIEESLSIGDFIVVFSNSESANLEQEAYHGAMMDAIQLPYASLAVPFDYDTIKQTAWHLLRSDHAPFWKQNIPALLITDTGNFRNPYYHTGTDCIQTLDFNFMKKVCQTIIAATINLAKQ